MLFVTCPKNIFAPMIFLHRPNIFIPQLHLPSWPWFWWAAASFKFYPWIGSAWHSFHPTHWSSNSSDRLDHPSAHRSHVIFICIQILDFLNLRFMCHQWWLTIYSSQPTHPHLWKLGLVGVKGDDHLVRELVRQVCPKHLVVLSLKHFTRHTTKYIIISDLRDSISCLVCWGHLNVEHVLTNPLLLVDVTEGLHQVLARCLHRCNGGAVSQKEAFLGWNCSS